VDLWAVLDPLRTRVFNLSRLKHLGCPTCAPNTKKTVDEGALLLANATDEAAVMDVDSFVGYRLPATFRCLRHPDEPPFEETPLRVIRAGWVRGCVVCQRDRPGSAPELVAAAAVDDHPRVIRIAREYTGLQVRSSRSNALLRYDFAVWLDGSETTGLPDVVIEVDSGPHHRNLWVHPARAGWTKEDELAAHRERYGLKQAAADRHHVTHISLREQEPEALIQEVATRLDELPMTTRRRADASVDS
jgi:hypothetical protein